MISDFNFLTDAIPGWVKRYNKKATTLIFTAALSKFGGGTHPSLELEIFLKGDRFAAKETNSPRWPRFCPERHINPGGDFCLGVDADVPIVSDAETASQWWGILENHLRLQFRADKQNRWPAPNSYPHGDAGNIQAEIEKRIASSPMVGKIEYSALRAAGILNRKIRKKLISRKGKRINKGLVPCVFLQQCACESRREGTISKRPVFRNNCEHRDLIYRIVTAEDKIEKAELEFWQSLKIHPKYKNFKCCGFSKDCGFIKG